MRIERIRGVNLTGLGDVDWTLPGGPVLLFSEERSCRRRLGNLLLELFYDLKTPNPLVSKDQSSKGFVEVWLTGVSGRFYIRRELILQGDVMEQSSNLEIEDETGQKVSLPESMTLGEYLFRVKLRAFRQGAIVEWPEIEENDDFSRRVRNLRDGGDEGLSLPKVRSSLAGAQKKVREQTKSMMLVKAEYERLRLEWEVAHRQQEEERLLLIEIKNLQETSAILAEAITTALKIQERLALLRQNPDYRKLRHLQGEITRLEERCRELETNLTLLTSESPVDWAVIESLREECMEWAYFQEQVVRLAAETQVRTQEIYEMQNLLQTSGYAGLSDGEVQRLHLAEEERDAAQQELEKLLIIQREIEIKQKQHLEEVATLQESAVMAMVTEIDEIKIAQKERHLAQWEDSKIGRFLDRGLHKHLKGTTIGERLSLHLTQYYQNYHVSNYKEFTDQLYQFRNRRRLVDRLRMELERLQEKVSREGDLRRIVHTRDEILNKAFTAVRAADFPTWLNGWEVYRSKKRQLSNALNEQHLELEKQELEEKKMAAAAEQLRVKLGGWETPVSNREDVLAAVLKVASQLRAKDEAEREVNEFSERYKELLGNRKMEQLAKILEPLADLERELQLSNEDGLAELAAKQNERVEIRRQLVAAEQRLQCSPKFPALSDLEKKIEIVKRQWVAYDDLKLALDDALALLETSWQEWQIKYGKVLKDEKQWIFSRISSSDSHETMGRDVAETKKHYFAYRMAIAQLTLNDNTEIPLLFTVGEINEELSFWEEVLGYLRKLSHSRQVLLCISDVKRFQKLAATGWQSPNNTP